MEDQEIEKLYAFWDACKHGDLPLVKKLIEEGVKPYSCSGFALTLAKNSDHLDVVEYLASL